MVHLLRHGEVDNPGKVLYGRLPGFHLSAAGREMAELAARWFAGRDVAAVIASPLVRARETAAPLARVVGVEVAVDPRLIESANVFEGSVVEVGPALLVRPHLWRHLSNPFAPSWGEPYAQVATRMAAAVSAAAAGAVGREVVLVSHQLPIWTLRRHLEGRRLWHRPDRRQCGLASVTSLGLDAGGRVVWLCYVEPVGPSGGASGTIGA